MEKNMKKFLMSTTAILILATAAQAEDVLAPTLFGGVNMEVKENAGGNYAATTTFSVGISSDGLAFGSASVESVNGATFVIDEWQLGTYVGDATVSFGKQGDLMVGNDFEIVGGTTLADVADDHESLQVSIGDAQVMVGFTDITNNVTDVENLQGAYSLATGQTLVTGVVDYNLNSEEWLLGAKVDAHINALNIGSVVTYGSENKLLGYELSTGYGIATAFVNGDQDDMLQNMGLGVHTSLLGLDTYAEGSYNLDSKDTTVGAGISFSF